VSGRVVGRAKGGGYLTACDVEKRIWSALTDGSAAVLTTHARLDGDAIGATLALYHALRLWGAPVHQVYVPPRPRVFEFLPGIKECVDSGDGLPSRFKLAVVDCASLARTGVSQEVLDRSELIINIDHHLTNNRFGHINYVIPEASSSGELIHRILHANGVALSKPMAECLFAAIVTDTGRFCHRNTTSGALDICAELVRHGACPHEIAERLFSCPSPAQVKLQTIAMQSLRFEAGGRIAVMTVSAEMFAHAGIGPADTQGLADIPVSIEGVEVGVLLKEIPGCDHVKASLRSRDAVDVCEVAVAFGGGGHLHAAGCEIRRPLHVAAMELVERVKAQLGA